MMDSSLTSPPHANACYEKMEEDLTCPVCLELYADPLMMTCSHSICKTCLNDIKTMREKLGKSEFECPTCRETHPITSDLFDKLPKNLALENIVIRFQEFKSTSLSRSEGLFDQSFASLESKSRENTNDDSDDVFDETIVDSTCGMCDDNQNKRAEWFCPQCDVLYCQNCLNTFHPRKGSLGRHKVCKPMQRKIVKENVLYCFEHTSERASIFCDTCKTVACHLCVCQGQGSHGNHIILDLNTAREKMQTTFSKATEDLTALISAFGLRDKEMDSQLDTIKALHDSAQSQITSQFQCFMSDAAATLHLARQKFQQTITSSSSQHCQPVESRSKQIKSCLSRCLNLMDNCNRLINQGLSNGVNINPNKPFQLSHQDDHRHFRARSLPQPFSSQIAGGNSSLSSSEDSPSSSSMMDHRKGPKTKPKSRRSLSLLDQREATQLPTQEFINRLPPFAKNQEELFPDTKCDVSLSSTKKKGGLEDGNNRVLMTSTPVPQMERKTNKSPGSSDGASGTNCTEMVAAVSAEKVDRNSNLGKDNNDCNNKPEIANDKKMGNNKNPFQPDKTNSELNTSKRSSPVDSRHGLKERGDLRTSESGLNLTMECRELKHDDLMLTQAAQIERILEEIAHLTKELDLMVVGNEEDLLSEVTRNLSSSLLSFNDVAVRLLSHLTMETNSDMSDIPIMMPAVRSVASPLSPGQKGAPRVQSRTLITWGFNSTSFTAEPVESRGQWTVNIARNTSHIGDLKTGYLFGVGVAKQSLSSKEQVGMNPYSYGIICSNGNLAFCHDSHVTPITFLSDLPLTIRLAVSSDGHLGIVLSYWIILPGSMGTIQGRRVIALHSRRQNSRTSHGSSGGGDSDGDCSSSKSVNGDDSNNYSSAATSHDGATGSTKSTPDKDGLSMKCKTTSPPNLPLPNPMLPVFTVSQRVKMTFPVNSDEP